MPKTLTMIDPRPNGNDGQYERGQTYTLADDLADYFLSIGVARYPTLQQTQVLADRDPATGEVSTIGTGRDPLGAPVVAVTSPGGGIPKRGTVVTTGNGVSGLPAGRLQELLSWLKPVHLPILDPAQFIGMTPVVMNNVTVSHAPGAGDYSDGAIRVSTAAAETNKSALLPLPVRIEKGVKDRPVRAAGAVHIRLKCADWSQVTRLYISLCQNDGFANRRFAVVIGDPKSRHGTTNPAFSGRWNAQYRTIALPSSSFSASGAPTQWGYGGRYFEGITGVFFTLTTTAAVTIDIDRIYSPDWPVGIVTPIFDGWYQSGREMVMREFLPRGWGAGGSQNAVEAGGIYPGYADLRQMSDLGFDVFAHGHDVDGSGNPIGMTTGVTAARYAQVLSQQRAALAGAGVSPDGMRWHQWLQNTSSNAGFDMAGLLKRQGIDACRRPCSDGEWGIDPYDTTYTQDILWSDDATWLPMAGRFNRIMQQAYENIPQGADYDHPGSNTTRPTLKKRMDYVALASQPLCPYNHNILDTPGPFDVSTAFGRDWVAHMDELDKAGKIVVTNPTTLEYLTFWRPGDVYMRWDGEWVYRHDPTRIAF